MAKRYDQYCAIAHALELVGERWSLLIVRELLTGPKRYTDLSGSLPRIGTNVLAARLKDLEAGGILTKRRLPPPTPAQVYELTPYGESLRPVMRELALWGIRSLGAPEDDDEFAPGWLQGALDTVFAPMAPDGSFEFRVGDEVASLVDGAARVGAVGAARRRGRVRQEELLLPLRRAALGRRDRPRRSRAARAASRRGRSGPRRPGRRLASAQWRSRQSGGHSSLPRCQRSVRKATASAVQRGRPSSPRTSTLYEATRLERVSSRASATSASPG